MSYAYPWVEGPYPDKPMPREQLEDRIEELLAGTNMCVMATIGKSGPIASPIEYYAHGLELFMLPDPGTPKLKALERDPSICVAVHRDYHGWHSGRGAQFFAKAQIINPGDKDWEHGMKGVPLAWMDVGFRHGHQQTV